MKNGKFQKLFSFLMMVFLITGSQVIAETVVVNIPVQDHAVVNRGDDDVIAIPEYGFIRDPGCPRLPARIYAVAIPPGAIFESVSVQSEEVDLGSGFNIAPALPAREIGKAVNAVPEASQRLFDKNQSRVYETDARYPEVIAEVVGTGGFRRYNIVDVRVTPFQFQPVTGTVIAHGNIALTVHYTLPDNRVDPVIDFLSGMESRADNLIVNYSDAQRWYAPVNQSRSLYDYVIITTSDMVNAVATLVDWETQKGRSVQTVTLEWITANYTGYDLAEKMRNFLREKYPSGEWGIEDVCLVGDMAHVPMRHIYDDPDTDLYFAELSLPDSGSWDANGNHSYLGSGDSCDFYAEVNVGRIPWSDYSTVQHICEKSAAYELETEPSFKKNILLLGAYFWSDTDNAVLMEAKVDQTWMADWTMTRMYEKNNDYFSTYPCDQELLRSNVVPTWSGGSFAFVNLAGHGSPTSTHIYGIGAPAFIDSADCSSLNDSYPAIVFADACSNSSTEELSIGASMLAQGAVGFVGSTRVAYGCPGWSGPLDGSSQSLDYYFTTGVTSTLHTQGAAHQLALQEVYQMNGWNYTALEMCEWTLYGNPNLGMGVVMSSDGRIAFDSDKYALDGTVLVTVRDMDLNINPETVDVVPITVITDTGDSETLVLSETDVNTNVFEGDISLVAGSPVPGNGYLDVQDGESVTAVYIDADDGHGGTNLEKTDMALIDGVGPVISLVSADPVTDTYATITWQTDEDAVSRVYYGVGTPDLFEESLVLTTDHSVTISGLDDCTTYVVTVESTDTAGNVTTDDNGGAGYLVTTWERVLFLEADMNTDPGWSVQGEWAWGQPTGQGGDYGSPDPTSGYTGSNVYGYNLNGDYPNSMSSPLYLTTDAFDCSQTSSVEFSFWCWLGVETSTYDHVSIDVSNNGGGTWENIWSNSGTLYGGTWEYWEFDISDIAAGHSAVQIRWGMGRTDSSWRYCGWNIDDVQVSFTLPCAGPTPTPTPDCFHDGDANLDGEVTAADAQLTFMIGLGAYTPTYYEACSADCNGDGDVTSGDAQGVFMLMLGVGECADSGRL